ncbi:16S rRNA (adenine(1518)-N(6)/adenine(1519)-N(6))-dimethyltransferase RsmA [Mycoplasma mycoides subsp. capri]|uniref:16S rRNA (adenine(1518)-N(6)/adenine(1519)-N(6))- dimethyltransferase RsmA n=1 Tax=Mycoplasma mycoides TaxID=2102 RepID=UPI0022405F1B|nr:16S rRNA (adenine(1518)-N(6)/adenine(1519)-N(6))-dimethyltransferase RsmA [Mycoplasma mycoides]UZK64290.1 16S rRNA (adenine(1518)-N(6)/adenine(1519)-N(6))-dimethyltransferase RsmA [Mycoplasma mycoides subsp. capri]
MKAKKYYGQNFISDLNLINRIVDVLDQNKDQLIIEIGPGKGALTKELVKRFDKVVAIEIDQDMVEILKTKFNHSNLEIIRADVLEIDLKQLISKYDYEKISIISNTPYYITSEILFKTLQISDLLTKAVFMLQKEVALRICSNKNENNYNNLSIACQFYSQRNFEFVVNKKMFYPIPKVDSAIISLTFNDIYKKQVNNDKKFIDFVRLLFNNKRKTILNNLNNIVQNKNKALEYLNTLNISSNLRPEQLDIDQYIKLFNLIYNSNF